MRSQFRALGLLYLRRGTPLASSNSVIRILEARFRTAHGGIEGILVGHVRCRDGNAVVLPEPGLGASASAATLMQKLCYLVQSNSPQPFERLQRLQSRFWSFVEVSSDRKGEMVHENK